MGLLVLANQAPTDTLYFVISRFYFLEIAMITPQQVEEMIKAELPDAQIQVQDLTGGGDHYQVTVVSSHFAGKGLVQQHQLVYKALQQAMSSEAIHALALKTYTPEAFPGQK